MRRWLLATMVLILVLCILVIVISPYVDLPLTTMRSCMSVLLFAQILLLGGILNKPAPSLPATGMSTAGGAPPPPLATAHRLHLLCAYLC